MIRNISPSLTFSWFVLATSIAAGSFAQVTLKHLTNTFARNRTSRALAALPWAVLWICLFAAATVCWLLALRQLDISYAYPLLSLGYVLVTALAAIFLGEHVSRTHWLAIVLITCGAALVAGSI